MKKLHLMLLLVLLIGLFISYNIGFKQASKQAIKTNEQYRKEIEMETLENNPIPQCDMGNCPEYKTFDVDEDGKDETIVLERFGMSQFAGRVFVVDEGKVVFVSKGEMFIGVKPIVEADGDHENENGFIIFYSRVPNLQSNKDVEWAYYKFVDGKYVLEKTVKPYVDKVEP